MELLGWLWLASPFAVMTLISRDRELLALVSTHHRQCQILGWGGLALMVLGVTVISGPVGSLMFLVGTPLGGLAVWGIRGGGDDGGGPGPDVPPISWDDFERSFWAYVRGRGGRRSRPRIPSVR